MHLEHASRSRAGFTLIELLVVIAIISILIGLTIGVGSAVVGSAKARQTADVLKTLDMMVSEARAATEAPVPSMVTVSVGNTNYLIPMVDGVYRADDFAGTTQTKYQIPTMAWYLKTITEYAPVPSAEALLSQIDDKFKRINLNVANGGNPQNLVDTIPGKRIDILDAWGNPIRMVHPKFEGVLPNPQGNVGGNGGALGRVTDLIVYDASKGIIPAQNVRRNYVSNAIRKQRADSNQPYMRGDSDGGSCQGDTPYFYSAGPDGDPSTRADNVYSIKPKFADPD